MDKKVIVIMTVVVCVCMALVGAGFYMMWAKIASLQPPEEMAEEGAEEEAMAAVPGQMFALETFVVNLADAQGRRYLRTTMQLELAPEQTVSIFEQRLPQIRDLVLTVLPSKTFEDICTAEGKSALRTEIIGGLNALLNDDAVANIYFTEFVIQ